LRDIEVLDMFPRRRVRCKPATSLDGPTVCLHGARGATRPGRSAAPASGASSSRDSTDAFGIAYMMAREDCLADADKRSAAGPLVKRDRAELDRPRSLRDIKIEGLWFTLARVPWRSLVLVPADEGASAVEVAAALADVGRRLRSEPVTFLLLSGPMDYAAAGKVVKAVGGRDEGAGPEERQGTGRLIIAIPPVVTDPLGLAITDVADAVVLCVERGESHLRVAERTVELVGRDRILGALML
jgi:hypothetical protein